MKRTKQQRHFLQFVVMIGMIAAASGTGCFFRFLGFPETNIVIVYLLAVKLAACFSTCAAQFDPLPDGRQELRGLGVAAHFIRAFSCKTAFLCFDKEGILDKTFVRRSGRINKFAGRCWTMRRCVH